MSWFSTYTDAPDVVTGKDIVRDSVRFFGLINKTYVRKPVTLMREIRGLTGSAADAAVTALSALDSVHDISQQSIGGGGFNVRYSHITGDTYVEET